MDYTDGQPMEPPFLGFVKTTGDALLLFQAARISLIPRITRRLNETERHNMIKSGSVFIWNEGECRIKRWTDSMTWSPSRITGNFLVYRETTQRVARTTRVAMGSRNANRSSASRKRPPDLSPEELAQRTRERTIVGSLADDTESIKPGGLVKRTMSLVIDGTGHHLISYYNPDDVKANKLATPSSLPRISAVGIPPDLLECSLRFCHPPRVELVNGVITYAGESAGDLPPHCQESPVASPVEVFSIAGTPSLEISPERLNPQIPFFDIFPGTNGYPCDTLTMPALKTPPLDSYEEPPLPLEASPTNKNSSRRRPFASHRHEPYPTSIIPRPRYKLSVSPETVVSPQFDWTYSTPNLHLRQSTSFDPPADDLHHISPPFQPDFGGVYSELTSVPGYLQLPENSFPEHFPDPFNLATGPGIFSEPKDAPYSHPRTHPRSPPLTPHPELPPSPHRPSLSVDTQIEHRFAYCCPSSTVSQCCDALITPPPTAGIDSALPSATQLTWSAESKKTELEQGFHAESDPRLGNLKFASNDAIGLSESAH